MRIDSVEIHHARMPLVYPFRTAFGNDDVIETIFVRLRAGDLEGWGETTPWSRPGYSPEWAAGAFLLLRDVLAPLVAGQKVSTPQDLEALLAGVKGNPFARAALDLAFWDLDGRRQGKPVYRLLGGAPGPVTVGADFGVMESIDALIKTIAAALGQGFQRVKLKFRPGWDLDMVRAVRESFPDAVFHIDCNSAYTLDDVDLFRKLDAFELAMIEQPLAHDDLLDHARLQRELRTPICLDESITSARKARQAIETGACRWVNIKPGRVGGLTEAVRIHNVCRDAGVPCWIGGMLESALGARACLALATLPNVRYPSDVFPSDRFFTEDLSAPPMALSGRSEMTPSEAPGLGAEPRAAALEIATMEFAVVRG